MKWFPIFVALLMPISAAAHDAEQAHYHAGEMQSVHGLLCDTREQATHIREVWSADGFEAGQAAFLDYNRDKSVSAEGACVWMWRNRTFIGEISEGLPVISSKDVPGIAFIAEIRPRDGEVYYAVIWNRVE